MSDEMMADMATPRQAIRRLSGHRPAASVIRFLREAEKNGSKEAVLDFEACRGVFPNGAAPLAAVVDVFRERGMTVRLVNMPPFVKSVRMDRPIDATKEALQRRKTHWNVIWRYTNSDQIFALSKALIEDLIERIEFGPGVLEALSWCLYEILDNALLHAKIGRAYIMLEYHTQTARLAVTIVDAGIGIHKSFVLGGHYRPVLAKDALQLAIQQWTSSTGEKRGNGLYGLAEVVRTNAGSLDLLSGRGALHCDALTREAVQLEAQDQLYIDEDHYCTVVDFQLSVANPVHISEVLGGAHVYNHEIEPLMDDDGVLVVRMNDYAEKVATREGAMALRVRLLNYLAEGAERVALDFTGVGLISSSFADETVGRLVEHFGVGEFRRLFQMRNVGPTQSVLVERAIAARQGSNPA